MKGILKKFKILFLLFLINILFIISIARVSSVPSGPTSVTNIGSSRYSLPNAANISAVAGNVTELNFAGTTITQTWQGYFGNVTGTIILGNSNNNTLYNWNLTSPAGQIYATRVVTVPVWANIRCANQTEVNVEDLALGINQSVDGDSVNRTFTNTTGFNSFYVGSLNINATQNCRAVQLFNSTGQVSPNFAEVLLSDTNTLIYTGLISNPALGFDNRTHQFEMLVGQNGHLGGTTSTPYYFYLELH